MIAAARRSGSIPPARFVSQRSAPSTVNRYGSFAPLTAPNAAQQSAVVLRLLRLRTVSPQPPPEFECSTNHVSPAKTCRCTSEHGTQDSRSTIASAVIAVAVERALLESSPVQ